MKLTQRKERQDRLNPETQRDTPLDPFNENTWSQKEKLYFENAKELLRSGDEGWIANGRPEHAVFLIAGFFDHAKEKVRLFSGSLTRKEEFRNFDIYANQGVINALICFLRKDGKECNIILEKELDLDETMQHPLIEAVKQLDKGGHMRGKFRIAKAKESTLKFMKERNIGQHFMLMDTSALRLETNQERVKAHVTFGESNGSKVVAELFDTILVHESSTSEYVKEYHYDV